jgi:hypothetical protein
MKPIVPSPAMRKVAMRVVWFKAADEALADPLHFLAHVMTYGTAEDLAIVRRAVPIEALRAVLDNPPPGVFDARSWSYWNLVLANQSPPPPLPARLGWQPTRPMS